jgi:basic membrane protein A and related proteins
MQACGAATPSMQATPNGALNSGTTREGDGHMRLHAAIAIALCALAAAGCSKPAEYANSPNSGATPGPKIAMVTDVGGLGDKSFNDSAHRGLLQAQTTFNAQVTVLQSRSATDYEPNLATLAQQNNQLVFAVGFLMHDSLNAVAPRFKQTHFAIIDSVVDQPNVTSITFKEEESSFLAGALAALVSKKATVAFLGGIDLPLIEKFASGFQAGVLSANSNVKVLVKYTGSFDDVAAGKEYAGVLFDQGADVVYAAAGKCGIGAIDEVKTRPAGTYIIGVDSDQDALAPGKVLTSALKRVDNAVFKVAQSIALGKSPPRTLVLGLKEGGVDLTPMKYTKSDVPAAALAEVNKFKMMIVSGIIKVPSTPDELKAFKPPATP